MKFSIGLVFYSGEEFLIKSVSSILSQSFSGFELLIRDQSDKKTLKPFLQKHLPQSLSDSRIKFFEGENLFHSGGHNFLINQSNGEIYVCGSIDMVYDKDFLQNAYNEFKNDDSIDALTGKILQLDPVTHKKTDTIDSCGLRITDNFHFYDRGQKQKKDLYSEKREVFGASGALFFMKKKVLEEIAILPSQYFERFLHYKNDIDLFMRFQLLGKKMIYIPTVFAWHFRHVRKGSRKSRFIRESSFFADILIFHRYYLSHFFSFKTKKKSSIVFFSKTFTLLFSFSYLFTTLKKFWSIRKRLSEKNSNIRQDKLGGKRIEEKFMVKN